VAQLSWPSNTFTRDCNICWDHFIYFWNFKSLENLGILATKVNKNPLWMVQRIFWEKRAKVAIFWGKESLRFPYLDNTFLEVAKTKQDSKKILFFCSQIWLISSCGWLQVHLTHKIGENEGAKCYEIITSIWLANLRGLLIRASPPTALKLHVHIILDEVKAFVKLTLDKRFTKRK